MKFAPSCNYEKTDQRTLGNGTAAVWISRGSEDSCWDEFLQKTPLGQFQQSTIWARAKEPEGWKPLRAVLTLDEEMVGGFQILWRPRWYGRIGYVSKGPVVLPGHPGLAKYATQVLRKVVWRERLKALVVQPPDLCEQVSINLTGGGFTSDVITGVNEATWLVDLRDGFEAVEQRMRKETRRKARQAAARNVKIREGTREDMETFFELMLSTCRRQEVHPNPSDVRTLFALWDAGQRSGFVRLTFAECEGRPLAGQVDICFGQTATQWKKGWTSTDANRFPNDLLSYQALRWATARGFRCFDFSALDKQMAITMLRGEPLSPEQERSRYIFLIRMGGSARLLPESRVYFPNPVIRLAYRAILYKRIGRAEENCRLARQLTESLREGARSHSPVVQQTTAS